MTQRIYITLFLTIMATSLGASLVLPLLPVYAQDLGATGLELGMIFSGFALARSIVLPLVGRLGDQGDRKKLIVLGLSIYASVAIGFVFSSQVVHLVLCRLIQGAGAAMVLPLARAYVGDLTPPGEEGRVMGHFNVAFYAGLTLGPWMGGYLKDSLGIQYSFYSMAILTVFGLALSWANLPRVQPGSARNRGPKVTFRAMLGIRELLSLFVFRWGLTVGVGMNWSFMPIYGHDVLHLSSTDIGILIGLNLFMTTLTQPWFGRLADRVSRPWLTFSGGLASSLCLAALPLCHTFGEMVVFNVLFGTANGVFMPPLMAMAVDIGRVTGLMGRVMSLIELAFSLAMVVGPVLAGVIRDTMGVPAIFVTGGGFGGAACVLFLILYRSAEQAPNSAKRFGEHRIKYQ